MSLHYEIERNICYIKKSDPSHFLSNRVKTVYCPLKGTKNIFQQKLCCIYGNQRMYQTERYAQIWDKTIDELVMSSSKHTKNCYFVKKCPPKLPKNRFLGKKCISCQNIQVKSEYLNSTSQRHLKNVHKRRLDCKNVFKKCGFMLKCMPV